MIMKRLGCLFTVGMLILLLPWSGWSQGTDFSEMQQWVTDTAHQGSIPVGTKITMSNWQQYKTFMPLGMIKLFEGTYGWKMPADVEMDVGPSHEGGNLPKTWVEATEKYSPQT